MRSDIILVANEGQVIPSTLGQKVVEDFDSCLGVAYVNDGKMVCETQAAGVTLEDFEGHQKDFSASTRVYQFAESSDPVKEEDLQPFILLTEGDDKVVAAIIAGRFDIENDGQMSDAYVLSETLLKEKLSDLWTLCDKDIGKLAARMTSGSFKKDMELLCKPFKATIVFMLNTGKVIKYSYSDDQADTTWGYTSSSLGIKEGIFPGEEKPSALGKKRFGIKASTPATVPAQALAPAVAPAAPAPSPQEQKPAVAPSPPIAEVVNKGPTANDLKASTALSPQEVVWVVPHEHMKLHKVEEWYRKRNNGIVPENYKQRPPIKMSAETARRQGSVKIVPEPTTKTGGYKAFEDAAKAIAPKIAASTPTPPPSLEVIPVYSKENIKKVGDLIQANKQIMDPVDWEKLENKYPSFEKAHALTPDDTARFPLKLRVEIARADPLQVAHVWSNLDHQRHILARKVLALEEELAKLKPKEPAVAAEPQKKTIGIRR